MKENKIKIIVGGYTAVGKSTISELIAIVLKKEGFNVVIENLDDIEQSDSGDGQEQARVREVMGDAIPNILEKTDKIIIEEVQFNRPLMEKKYAGLSKMFDKARKISDKKYYKPKKI